METTLEPSQAPAVTEPASTEEFKVTASAIKQIDKILSTEPEGSLLRLSVEGGGCSGFQYKYDITREVTEEDLRIEGSRLLVDKISLDYLKGSQLDYKADLMGAAFKISNPQATASCGCGSSFAM